MVLPMSSQPTYPHQATSEADFQCLNPPVASGQQENIDTDGGIDTSGTLDT